MGELICEQTKENALDYSALEEDPFDHDLEIYVREGKVFMLADAADGEEPRAQEAAEPVSA